jgi:hypothetical protein
VSDGLDPRELDRTAHPNRVVYSMRALGKEGLPDALSLGGTPYRLYLSVKHDFFAATAFYRDCQDRIIVLKIGRTADFAGLPMRWLGRWSCRRELRFYRALADVPSVPRVLGTVGDTGFVHCFVPGRPLSRDLPVPDGFFDQLGQLFDAIHQRDIAYVDTNKPQNILIGIDRRPYLIDFQISCDLHLIGDWWLARVILRHFQKEDRYHLLKHRRRMRPDEMTPGELDCSRRKSALLRLHRLLFRPWFLLRRRTFKRLRDTGRLLPEGSK